MSKNDLAILFSLLSTLVYDFDVSDEELESFITDEQAEKFDAKAKELFPLEDRKIELKQLLINRAKDYLAQL